MQGTADAGSAGPPHAVVRYAGGCGGKGRGQRGDWYHGAAIIADVPDGHAVLLTELGEPNKSTLKLVTVIEREPEAASVYVWR